MQGAQPSALGEPRGWGAVGGGREVQREGMCVYLPLIHVDVWQKSAQFCKATILQ